MKMKFIGGMLILAAVFSSNCVNGEGLAGGHGLQFEELIPSNAYNSETVETVKGTVKEIIKVSKFSGIGNTVVLLFTLSTTGDIYVVLAPDWFMENQDYRVKEGDYLTITGSKIDYEGKTVILAAQVERGDQIFKLRNPTSGKAEWIEWRKGEEIFYKNYSW